MILETLILSIIGFCISLYTYVVEQIIKTKPEYRPACDINDYISCTKPMKTPYANIFYVSNAIVGILYYVLVAILSVYNAINLLLIVAIGACLVSIYLAYLLYFKIKALCILCTALYIINFLIFSFVIHRLYV